MGIQEALTEAAKRQAAMKDALIRESEKLRAETEDSTDEQTTAGGSPTGRNE